MELLRVLSNVVGSCVLLCSGPYDNRNLSCLGLNWIPNDREEIGGFFFA